MVTRYTQRMATQSSAYESVRDQVLQLDDEERQILMAEVAASFESEREPGYEKAWAAELRERLDDIDRGRAELLDEEQLDAFVWGEGAGESA